MALQIQNLDLEEQEQLAALKHFWNRWGNLITWVLVVVLGALAAWNAWQYWQRQQAAQASAVYAELERAAIAADVERTKRPLADLQSQYGKTLYATHGSLLAAKTLSDLGAPAEARAALDWVLNNGQDEALRAVARLRLASLQMEDKAYDEALKTLSASVPPQFVPLVADRRGDALLLQGQREQAAAEYSKAYQALSGSDISSYSRLIAFKLNALGIKPEAPTAGARS